jgi:hypothetical protein
VAKNISRFSTWESLTGICTAIVAVATIANVCIAAVQWIALKETVRVSDKQASIAERSLNETRESTRKITRAYISVERTQITKTADYFSAGVDFKNNGQTPAFVTSINYNLFFSNDKNFDSLIKRNLPKGDPDAVPVFLPAATTSSRRYDFPVSESDYRGYPKGDKDMYLVGEISYRDIYGDSHVTYFCVARSAGLDRQNTEMICAIPDHEVTSH